MVEIHKTFGVHGNLKSSNCLVDSRWVVKVSDFGYFCLLDKNDSKSKTEFDDMRGNVHFYSRWCFREALTRGYQLASFRQRKVTFQKTDSKHSLPFCLLLTILVSIVNRIKDVTSNVFFIVILPINSCDLVTVFEAYFYFHEFHALKPFCLPNSKRVAVVKLGVKWVEKGPTQQTKKFYVSIETWFILVTTVS